MSRRVNLFTSTYDNFIQTVGIRDGVSDCVKILSVFYDNLDTSDLNDPEVIIKIDILESNTLNSTTSEPEQEPWSVGTYCCLL